MASQEDGTDTVKNTASQGIEKVQDTGNQTSEEISEPEELQFHLELEEEAPPNQHPHWAGLPGGPFTNAVERCLGPIYDTADGKKPDVQGDLAKETAVKQQREAAQQVHSDK